MSGGVTLYIFVGIHAFFAGLIIGKLIWRVGHVRRYVRDDGTVEREERLR